MQEKKLRVTLAIYATREGQYEIKIYVAPHNETYTSVLNKIAVTVETNNRNFS